MQSEWCYNYHDAEKPWAFRVQDYPKPEDQHLFITAYVKHKPGPNTGAAASPFATPHLQASSGITPRLAPLDLDADSASSVPTDQQLQLSNEASEILAQQDAVEADVQFLIRQTRLWRAFNAAQWAAWGVVQAKIPGMEEGITEMALEKEKSAASNDTTTNEDSSDDGGEEEFDYLAYAQDRVMFFWADLLSFGLVKEDELPPHMLQRVKAVELDY